MIKSFNKASLFLAAIFCWVPLGPSLFVAHMNWKRGKVPRLMHYDPQ